MAMYRWRDHPDVVARLVNADKIKDFFKTTSCTQKNQMKRSL